MNEKEERTSFIMLHMKFMEETAIALTYKAAKERYPDVEDKDIIQDIALALGNMNIAQEYLIRMVKTKTP